MKRSIVVFILLFFIYTNVASADWAYRFVVYSGNVYVVTDTAINSKQIERKIGQVTRYSDREGTYSGNFSNRYPKGTEYYSIIGISKDKEIAIKQDENMYIKAIYQGKYAGNKSENFSISSGLNIKKDQTWILIIIGVAALVMFFIAFKKFKRSKST